MSHIGYMELKGSTAHNTMKFILAFLLIAGITPAYAKPCYSTVQPGSPAAFKCVTNRGLLTRQERLLLNPNSTMQGASIKAIPGESRLSFQRRLNAAVKKFHRQFAK